MRIVSLRDHPDGLDVIAEWVWQTWERDTPGCTLAVQTDLLRQEFLAHNAPHPVCFMALDGRRIVGTASLCVADGLPAPWDTVTPWLASVFVPPEARRRGIASTLVTHVGATARDLGFAHLHLYTPDQQALYHRHGYVEIGRSEAHHRSVDVMRLTLAALTP